MKYLNKLLILIVIFFLVLILESKSSKFKDFIDNEVLSNNISFYTIKKIYNKYFGNILLFDDVVPVFEEDIKYDKIEVSDDTIKLYVYSSYLIPSLSDGVVVFTGDKDEYKDVVIVEGEDTIYYIGVNSMVSLYDNVSKNSVIASSINDTFDLKFMHEKEIIDYKKYIF